MKIAAKGGYLMILSFNFREKKEWTAASLSQWIHFHKDAKTI